MTIPAVTQLDVFFGEDCVGALHDTSPLSQEFAFSIGGEVMPGAITQAHIRQMAQDMGIRPDFALGIARDMVQKVPRAVDATIAWVLPVLPPGAKTLALRLQKFVLQTTRQTAGRILKGSVTFQKRIL